MPDQKNRNILVSGGAGYIGSTTVRSLKAAGYHPIVIDDFSTGHREFVAGVEYVEGNVADGTLVAATVRKYGIGAAMHFASFINVGDSVKEPAEYYLNNVSSGIAFIAALQKAGVKKFILSSTCAVYGALEKPQPLNESMPIAPLNPYAHAKRMLEIVLEDFTRAYDFHAVIFRYFNAAGAAADGLTGEWHEPETHLIPNILRAALSEGKNPVKIFGNDYAVPGRDGTAVRDYIHVADLADAHIRGIGYLDENRGCHVFNLGTGDGVTVLEVIRATEKVLGLSIASEMHPRRAGDAPFLVADSGKAARLLGWRPDLSDMENIIKTAYAWENKLAALKNRNR